MQNKGQTISREKIYEKVWGFESDAESNNLEAYLSFIRKKIRFIGSKVQIKAIRGLGYKLEDNLKWKVIIIDTPYFVIFF